MRRLAVLVAILAAAGCKGTPENDFVVAFELAWCEQYVSCASDEMLAAVGQRECLQFLQQQPYPEPPECRYDRVAAELCLEDLEEAGCDGVNPARPASCHEVYSECPFGQLPEGTDT